jgi:predicted PurR-regulated permease PerM
VSLFTRLRGTRTVPDAAAPTGRATPDAPPVPDPLAQPPVEGFAPRRRRRPVAADDEVVPRGVRLTAAWSWRLLVIAAALGVGIWVVARLQLVIVPIMIALLLSALIQPVAAATVRRGARPALAAALVMAGSVVVIGLLVWLIVRQFANGYSDLASQVDEGVAEIRDWLVTGPLSLSQGQIDSAIQGARDSIRNNRSTLTSGALTTATTVGHVLTGALLTLFATFFFIKDGPRIWAWVVRLFPSGTEQAVHGAGLRAWRTLIHYVRATIAVAAVDAVGIGLAAAVLGVPLALPLGVLVFLGAFVPIIGAFLTGLVAVLVALVAKGPVTALLLLAAVILVQQVEGHVLQPLLLGRAVKVHPLAVVFSIAAGVLLAGIVGALVAVPLVAVANTVASHLSGGQVTATPTAPAEESDAVGSPDDGAGGPPADPVRPPGP